MTTNTSKEALRELQSKLSARQAWALGAVRAHPGKTARELEKLTGYPDLHKRLPELQHLGKVKRSGLRECSITGRRCWTWSEGRAPYATGALPKKQANRTRLLQHLGWALRVAVAYGSAADRALAEKIQREVTP